jgi:hypothetical protein
MNDPGRALRAMRNRLIKFLEGAYHPVESAPLKAFHDRTDATRAIDLSDRERIHRMEKPMARAWLSS